MKFSIKSDEILVHIELIGLFVLLGPSPCGADGHDPMFVVVEASSIQSLSVSGSISTIIGPSPEILKPVAIDVFSSEGRMYWSDVRLGTISTSYINGTANKTIVQKLSVPDGLAVDWLGRLVYFTDTGLNVIGVTNLEGTYTMILLVDNLDEPRAIALDPVGGYMYWTDWGAFPKIEKAYMSGRRRETLIDTGVLWPNGLALDLIRRRLYWADALTDKIETSLLDGSARRSILQKSLTDIHPFGIAVIDSELYWSNWKGNGIHKTSIDSGATTLFATLTGRPFGIVGYKSSRQAGTNACSRDNGGCEQLCLAEPSSALCACSFGVLQEDYKTCKVPGQYFLVTDNSSIRGLSVVEGETMATNAIQPIPTSHKAEAVQFDSKTGRVFYTNVVNNTIIQVDKDGSEKIVLTNLSDIEGIGFDWTANNLYFVDSGYDVIGVTAVDRPLRKDMITSGLDEPRSIVLDPVEGMMYWTDWGLVPKIEGAYMSGASRRTVLDRGLGWPNGITLDRETKTLYWADAKLDRIGTCKTDGTACSILLYSTSDLHPFGVAFFGSYLVWTDWRLSTIVLFNIHVSNYTAMKVQFPALAKPSGIVLRDSLPKDGNCSVNNGNCAQLCLPVPSGRRCACDSSHSGDCLPEFLSSASASAIEVREGRRAVLPCVVADEASSGLPLVRVEWLKNSQTILSTTRKFLENGTFPYVINAVAQADGGRYTCRVTNSYGAMTTSLSLVVRLDSWFVTTKAATTATQHAGKATSMGTLASQDRGQTDSQSVTGTSSTSMSDVSTPTTSTVKQPNGSNDTKTGNSFGLIIGLLVVGCLIATLLVIIGTTIWCKRWRRKTGVSERHSSGGANHEGFSNPTYPLGEGVSSPPSKFERNVYSESDQGPLYAEIESIPKPTVDLNRFRRSEYENTDFLKSVGTGNIDHGYEQPRQKSCYVEMKL